MKKSRQHDDISASTLTAVEQNDLKGMQRLIIQHGRDRILNYLHRDDKDPYRNSGTVLHWCVWHRHWELFRLCAVQGAKLEVKGSGGGWLNGRTPEQYAKWLDDKAGHPWYEHQKEIKECVKDAEKCNLSKVFIQEPIPRVSTLTLEHKYALNEMVEQNALDSLKTSVERCGIQILHAQVHAKGEANYACTIMHACVWHRHWEMLRFCIEKGANIETKASGMYWVGGKSVKEYAKKLDDECGHNYYKHVEMVDKCIEEAKADHEDAKSGNGAGNASSSNNGNAQCVVCLERPRTRMCTPCNHLCLCEVDASSEHIQRCPICRVPVTGFTVVYNP